MLIAVAAIQAIITATIITNTQIIMNQPKEVRLDIFSFLASQAANAQMIKANGTFAIAIFSSHIMIMEPPNNKNHKRQTGGLRR